MDLDMHKLTFINRWIAFAVMLVEQNRTVAAFMVLLIFVNFIGLSWLVLKGKGEKE